MSKSDDKDDKRPKERRTGSVVPEDDEFTEWLNRLWARDEVPERVEVWQTFGRNKRDLGEMIHHEDFKPGKKDIEEVNRIANEILGAAQNDCEVLGRESWYTLRVIDRNRRSSPLVRRVGPMSPRSRRQLARGDEAPEDWDDEDPQNPRALAYAYNRDGLEQQRWDKQRYDKVMGEMLVLQFGMIQELRAQHHTLFSQQMSFFEKMQEAEDRRLDRDLIREREKFKLGLWQDGWRTARNLVPSLFADKGGNGGGGGGNNDGGGTGNSGNAEKFGASPERALVDNFLTDCENNELSIPLFGDVKENEGKMELVKPGIFSIHQLKLFYGVREGQLAPKELDVLMPDSGHELAITADQVNRAIAAGMTDGIGSAVFELLGLRKRAREERQNQTNPAGGSPADETTEETSS